MAEKVVVTVLSCGQGMANWIEYYESTTDPLPSGLGLVDLGGKGTGHSAAVDFIIGRLVEMKDDGLATRIDAVVVSHQDSDHWNLIPHLFDQIKKKKIDLATG